jgi:hypothetical protein
MPYLREFRQSQTIGELDRLRDELSAWTECRKRGDPRGQYASQLDTLGKEIGGAIEALRESVSSGLGVILTGDLFRRLAVDDRRIIWIRGVWDYFRQKFDQRDDDTLRPVLRAADEVVWSCYRPFFANRAKPPPAPLCCIDPSYVASSVRPDQAAHQFERTSEVNEGPLADYLLTMPIPIVRLPPVIISSPWALSLIGTKLGISFNEWSMTRPDYSIGCQTRSRALWTEQGAERRTSRLGHDARRKSLPIGISY